MKVVHSVCGVAGGLQCVQLAFVTVLTWFSSISPRSVNAG